MAGPDNLAGKFLKDGASILATPMTELCNLSISFARFPNDCKQAKWKPLFKKGNKDEPKNYPPISLLPQISKVIEKIVYGQILEYLDENKILYHYQSGFRPYYSTDTCLSHLSDKIVQGFENSMFTGMILTALKKSCMAGRNIGILYTFLISHIFAVALRRNAVFLLSNL